MHRRIRRDLRLLKWLLIVFVFILWTMPKWLFWDAPRWVILAVRSSRTGPLPDEEAS